MIISHRHNFIFMHSLKTAGSSLTISLQPFLGEEDYLSIDSFVLDDFRSLNIIPRPFFSEKRADLLTSEGFVSVGEFMRQALSQNSFTGLTMSSGRLFAQYQKSSLYRHKLRQHGHLSAVRESFKDEFFGYYKFALERQPFDKIKSLYRWRWSKRFREGGDSGKPSFKEFVMSLASSLPEQRFKRSYAYSSFPIYSVGGDVAVDELGDYSRLPEFVKSVYEKLGLSLVDSLPSAKKLNKAGEDRLEYDEEMKMVVREKMSREFSLFSEWR
jgi:hypothetical protein